MNSKLKIENTEVIKEVKKEEISQSKKIKKEEKIKLTEEEKKIKAKERYAIYRLTIRDKSQKVDCECGSNLLLDNMARHKKSIKHIEYMKANTVLDNEGNINIKSK